MGIGHFAILMYPLTVANLVAVKRNLASGWLDVEPAVFEGWTHQVAAVQKCTIVNSTKVGEPKILCRKKWLVMGASL